MAKSVTTTSTPAPRSPEVNLWRAVFLQMVRDAKSPRPNPERGEARRWFIFSREGVPLVLELGDFDVEAVRESLNSLIAGWDTEDEASRLINMRRRRGRPRKAVSTWPPPCAKRRSKANA